MLEQPALCNACPRVRVMGYRRIVWVAVLCLLWVSSAQAGSVAILRPIEPSSELSEAVFRLQGELLALGLRVEIADRAALVAAGTIERRVGIERWAYERGNDAVIDVIGTVAPTAVEVWLFERSPRRASVTRVTLGPSAPGASDVSDRQNAAETLALRAIEVLRSSFLEAELAAAAKHDTPHSREPAVKTPSPPASSAPSAAQQPSERLGLEVGAAVLTSLEGVGPALSPLVRIDWVLSPRIEAQVTLSGFGTRPALSSEAGSARVAQQYAVIGLCYCAGVTSAVRPLLSLAAGALRTAIEGQADAPERGHALEQWSLLLDASLGARVGLPAGLYFALASHVQLATPHVAIHFVEDVVARSGRPNLLLSSSLGARW
jgi:hypothetical protein